MTGACAEVDDAGEEGREFRVAGAYRGAGGAVGVERPEEEREGGGPGASGKKQQGVVEGFMPVGGGRADAADEDDLDQDAGGGEGLPEDG